MADDAKRNGLAGLRVLCLESRRGQEMDKHRRTAAVTSGDESIAAAQAIVTLRRQSQRTGEGTS